MNRDLITVSEPELDIVLSILTKNIQDVLDQKFHPCILLSGEMGAGKTTLVREWLKSVGSKELANSPTFALHNLYNWNEIPIHHFDLYRLKDLSEIDDLGFTEIWGLDGISLIEWWKLAESLIPNTNRVYVDIETVSFNQRSYRIYKDSL